MKLHLISYANYCFAFNLEQKSAVSSEYEAKTGLTLSNLFQNYKLEKIFLYKTTSFNMVFSFKQLSLLQTYFFMLGSCQNNVWTGSCI